MKSENLYTKIESAFIEQGFNFRGVWDKISYTSKMLICDRIIESGSWTELPEEIVSFQEII